MSEIKKILFPTDFSETADAARVHAMELARRFDAQIIVLHVRTVYADDPQKIKEELEKAAGEDALHARMGDLGDEVEVETQVVRSVSQAGGILDFLFESKVDLVVMGTHGRSGLSRFLLGSVAEKVVRHAPCPVLTVGHVQKSYRASPHYKKILVGFDFSKNSRQAALHAAHLARRFAAQLHVLYVLEQEVRPAHYDHWTESMKKALPEIERDARQALEQILEGEKGVKPEIHVKVNASHTHTGIVEFAKKNEIDLIVLGTHGLSGLEHMLLGSTAERVVRLAACPVLTYKLGQD